MHRKIVCRQKYLKWAVSHLVSRSSRQELPSRDQNERNALRSDNLWGRVAGGKQTRLRHFELGDIPQAAGHQRVSRGQCHWPRRTARLRDVDSESAFMGVPRFRKPV